MNVLYPSTRKLIRNQSIIDPVKQILGSDVYVFQCVLNLKKAFTGDVWQWHRARVERPGRTVLRVPVLVRYVPQGIDPEGDPLQAELFENPPAIKVGWLKLNPDPGLGLTLSEKALKKYGRTIAL